MRRGLTIDDLLVVVAAFVGFVWTLSSVSDNTMFVHLRTGIDIVNSGHFPRSDPYSYTAHGHPWVLQSWLSEVFYGVLHFVGTTKLVVLVNALMFAVIAGGTVVMARTGNSLRTFACAISVLFIGMGQWSTRPTTIAFFLFFTLVATRKVSLWWTALIGALWVNAHGSWPVGIVWLAACAVGASLDTSRFARAEFKRLGVFVAAVVVAGVVNPIGWRLLQFPITAIRKGEIFKAIREWQSPDFHNYSALSGGFLLVGIFVMLFVLIRNQARWHQCLGVVALLALTLYSQRNAPFLAIAAAPVMGELLRRDGVAANRRWGPVEMFAIACLVFVAGFQTVRLQTGSAYAFGPYPVSTMAYAESLGYFAGDKHLLAPDYVGCYRILQKGADANVFIDDRYDMYPTSFALDALKIGHLDKRTDSLLDQFGIQGVIWHQSDPLATYLRANPHWKQVMTDKDWAFFVRA